LGTSSGGPLGTSEVAAGDTAGVAAGVASEVAAGRLDRGVLRRVVEETLRLHSPVGTSTRQTTRPAALADVEIPAGDVVSAVLSSANRDERHWADADRFRLDRREGPHVAFAAGAHRCLGEWLGRREILVGVERLLLRLPRLRLAGDVSFRGFEFRGPEALPVAWEAPS
ncbi:MAG: cytochrome P450, partial [Acidimicrobiales bacterium]